MKSIDQRNFKNQHLNKPDMKMFQTFVSFALFKNQSQPGNIDQSKVRWLN